MLNAWGQLGTDRGRYVEALASFREALAGLRGGVDAPMLEMAIRLNGCRLYLAWDRLPDAEDAIRLAEETAVTHNFTHQLGRIYMLLGYVQRTQGDEAGFVFFEKAIELCRGRRRRYGSRRRRASRTAGFAARWGPRRVPRQRAAGSGDHRSAGRRPHPLPDPCRVGLARGLLNPDVGGGEP